MRFSLSLSCRLLRLDDGRTREEFHLDFDRAGPIDICESVEGCNVAFVVPANLDDCPKEWADRTNRYVESGGESGSV